MIIVEQDLMAMATAYIEDGILRKWRFDSVNKTHIDATLNVNQYINLPLTQDQIDYILQFENVVVVNGGVVKFHNFSGQARIASARRPPIQRSIDESLAQLVRALMEKTGHGMMDCKMALQETDRDVIKAEELLKERDGHPLFRLENKRPTGFII